MSEWQVLDLDGDPAPGDPVATRTLATRLLSEADLAEASTRRLRAVASADGDLRMEGDYAPKFREVLGELPGELDKLTQAYRRCGSALSAYAESLAEAKGKAATALGQGRDADGRYQGAVREVRSLIPPDRQAVLDSGRSLNESTVDMITADLDEGLKAQARAAAVRARVATGDRDRARRLAEEAARLRGDAVTRCVSGIESALSGIKNKAWYEKAWDAVSAPFRSWDDFVNLCRNVALVAGVVALFISGPIGLALVAIALVAGAVAFGDTLGKVIRGEAGLGALALDALGLIPGARGVLSLGRLAVAARGLAGTLRAGGGRLVSGALNVARGAVPAIRNAVSSVRATASNWAARAVKLVKDPIDVSSGEMAQQQTDLELDGALPLLLRRVHLSSYRVGRWFGPSWASTLDQRLEVDGAGVCFATADGALLVYPTPPPDQTPVLPEEGPRLPLARAADGGGFTITEPDLGRTLHFRPTNDTDPGLQPLAAVTDRNGNRIDLGYAADGTLSEIRHSGGYRVAVDTHDGRITALRLHDTAANVDHPLLRFGYTADARLTEVTNSSQDPWRFDYDTHGRMVRWEDRNGTWYEYTYDALGRCIRTAGAGGCLDATIDYNTNDKVTTVTDAFGRTAYHLNEAGQIIRLVDPLGHATESQWDRYDRLLTRTDPLGRTVRYDYDDDGRLVALTRPDGSLATAAYGEHGLPVTVTDPDGATWRYRYDERGNLIFAEDPIGSGTSYAFNERGHLRTVTDALGGVRHVDTDPAGLPVAVTDPLGATTSIARDAFGRVVTMTDPLGAATRFTWTVEGNLASRVLPDGATDRWRHDGEGNLVEHIDPLGQRTHFEIGHFDLPTARTGPDGARLEFGYDTELRLVSVTNPQGLVWLYDFDPAGNLARETDFDGRVLAYAYDAAGQLRSRTNGAGETVEYLRDVLGNVVRQHAGGSVTTYRYDGAGRLVRARNADAELTFERDPAGRVVAETCNGRSVSSTLDPLGRRVRRRTPSGAESVWEYDASDRPTVLHTAGRELRFGYDAAGREVERRLDGGLALFLTWDANSQLRSQLLTAPAPDPAGQDRVVQRQSYDYRADGYVIGVGDAVSGDRRLELDPAGRVTRVSGRNWTERYTYDPAGNITEAAWPSGASLEAQGSREYTGSLIRRAGNVRYEYDAQGRVTLKQYRRHSAKPLTWRYTWDAEDRLVALTTADGQRWRYRYDPLGRRIAKQRLDADDEAVIEQVDFAWDGVVLAEQVAAGRVTAWDWEPGSFRPISQTERRSPLVDASQEEIDERFLAIVTDLVGSPTELVGPDGEVVWQDRRTLWGVPVAAEPGQVDCPLRFPGQYLDAESGIHYNFLRYYDPLTGRYASSDPLRLAGGARTYDYPANPTVFFDPFALAPYTVTVYRTESGVAASHRITVDAAGNVSIAGEGMLFLNFGQLARAESFRGPLSTIYGFDVPATYLDDVRRLAVPQRRPPGMSRRAWNEATAGQPQRVDPAHPDQYGLPAEMFPDLLAAVIPGSGRIIR